jgi:hypothetical protein
MLANWEVHSRDTRDPKSSGKTLVVVAQDIANAISNSLDSVDLADGWEFFTIDSVRLLNKIHDGD